MLLRRFCNVCIFISLFGSFVTIFLIIKTIMRLSLIRRYELIGRHKDQFIKWLRWHFTHDRWLGKKGLVDKGYYLMAENYAKGLLLDIGCGLKPHRIAFDRYVDRYIGIDLRSNEEDQPDLLGSALYLPFKDRSIDTVVSFVTIEHVPEPWMMFEEVSRVIRPGGYFIISAPQSFGLHGYPHDYFRFTRYGLEYLAKRSGFEVISCNSQGDFWFTFSHLFRIYIYGQGVRSGWAVVITNFILLFIDKFALFLDRYAEPKDFPPGYMMVVKKMSHEAQPHL